MELMNEYLKRNLKPRRYTHSLGVVETATKLAEIYGADREKAHLAALVHDIAKCLTSEESNRLVRFYGLPWKYWNNQPLAHSKLGVALLRDEFGVTDEMVCSVLQRSVGKGVSGAAPSQGLTPRAKSVVELAVSEAAAPPPLPDSVAELPLHGG